MAAVKRSRQRRPSGAAERSSGATPTGVAIRALHWMRLPISRTSLHCGVRSASACQGFCIRYLRSCFWGCRRRSPGLTTLSSGASSRAAVRCRRGRQDRARRSPAVPRRWCGRGGLSGKASRHAAYSACKDEQFGDRVMPSLRSGASIRRSATADLRWRLPGLASCAISGGSLGVAEGMLTGRLAASWHGVFSVT